MPRTVLAAFTLVSLTGCGDGPIPIETAPVSGTATYQGKPLEGYRVFFFDLGHPAQEPATGRVAPDGSFTLSVREEDDGAMVGLNQVWLVYDPEVPPQTPGLEGPVTFPPPKVKPPEKYMSRTTSGLTVEVPASGLADYKLELK